jgi:hypothetical protein
MNGDTIDSDDSDHDRELDVGIPLSSISYLSCRNAMRDNGRLQLLVDQKDEKIKTLEFKVNMTSPGDLMLRNIITAKSNYPSYPLDQLQSVVAEFLSTCRTNTNPLETKSVGDSMHFLHEFGRGQTAIFPFMKFEIFDIRFVFSAYLSEDGINMWWFAADEYREAMQYARSKRVAGYEIRDGIDSEFPLRGLAAIDHVWRKKTIIDNVWRTIGLQKLSRSNIHRDIGENMYRSAATSFVDDFRKNYAQTLTDPGSSEAPVSVLDLNPSGIFLSIEEDDTFYYETNTRIRPFVLKTKSFLGRG